MTPTSFPTHPENCPRGRAILDLHPVLKEAFFGVMMSLENVDLRWSQYTLWMENLLCAREFPVSSEILLSSQTESLDGISPVY